MNTKVIWKEGMALSPHHFQQSEEQNNFDSQFKWGIQSPYFYGVKTIAFNEVSLSSGEVSIQNLSGIFRDGTVFSLNTGAAGLLTRSFEGVFGHQRPTLDVYLSIPNWVSGGANLTSNASDNLNARFYTQIRDIADNNTGKNNREIEFASLNFRIHFEGENLDGYQSIKICRLGRNAQGQAVLLKSYIPPLIQIGGSVTLINSLKELIEIVSAKSNHLMAGRSKSEKGAIQFRPDFFNNFLILSSLNRELPLLNYYYQNPSCHPETLFLALIGFCGSLSSFGANSTSIFDFQYNHSDLKGTFDQVFSQIKSLLNDGPSSEYRIIPANRISSQKQLFDLSTVTAAHFTHYFLAATGNGDEAELIQIIQKNVKACPTSKLDSMITAATSGIPFVLESVPPASIPIKVGYKYFRLDNNSTLFREALGDRSLAIHMPSIFSNIQLELVAAGA